MVTGDKGILLAEEDFGKAKRWSPGRIQKAISAFMRDFERFADREQRILGRAYLSRTLGMLTREICRSNNVSTREAQRLRQRRSRERKQSRLSLPSSGKGITAPVYYQCELMYYLMHGNGSKIDPANKYMTQEAAARLVARWLLILGLVHGRSGLSSRDHQARAIFEDKVKNISESMRRSYREWDPRELPNVPRGVAVYGGRKAGKAVERIKRRPRSRHQTSGRT